MKHKLCIVIISALFGIALVLWLTFVNTKKHSFDTYAQLCYADSTAERVFEVAKKDTVITTFYYIQSLGQTPKPSSSEIIIRWNYLSLTQDQYLSDKYSGCKLLYSYEKWNHLVPTQEGYEKWKADKYVYSNFSEPHNIFIPNNLITINGDTL